MASLYLLNPPRRNSYANMKIIKKKDFSQLTPKERDNNNYLVIVVLRYKASPQSSVLLYHSVSILDKLKDFKNASRSFIKAQFLYCSVLFTSTIRLSTLPKTSVAPFRTSSSNP